MLDRVFGVVATEHGWPQAEVFEAISFQLEEVVNGQRKEEETASGMGA